MIKVLERMTGKALPLIVEEAKGFRGKDLKSGFSERSKKDLKFKPTDLESEEFKNRLKGNRL